MTKDARPDSRHKPRAARRRMGAPTIADVAREALCSPMTVSRVINAEVNVRDVTRTRVLAAIARLNYSPNQAARNLAGGEQARIALLFDNPSASYLSEFLLGALAEASRRDVQLVVQSCDSVAAAKVLLRNLAGSGVHGFILPAPLCEDCGVLALLAEIEAIAVAVGPGMATEAQATVLIDEFQAAYDMTRHIIGLGHRRIGFIVGNPEHLAADRRLKGYLAALGDAGLEVEDRLIVQGWFSYRSGLEAARQLLCVDPRPTAIFASNDDMAAAAVAMAHRHQLDVPGDITVCGFDDTAMARTIWPELTTIRQPIGEMSAWAVGAIMRMLRARRQGEPIRTECQIMPYTLVGRESDAAPGTGPG